MVIRISKTWYFIGGLGLFIGILSHFVFVGFIDEVFEFIGVLLISGSIICALTGLIIKYIRKKKIYFFDFVFLFFIINAVYEWKQLLPRFVINYFLKACIYNIQLFFC